MLVSIEDIVKIYYEGGVNVVLMQCQYTLYTLYPVYPLSVTITAYNLTLSNKKVWFRQEIKKSNRPHVGRLLLVGHENVYGKLLVGAPTTKCQISYVARLSPRSDARGTKHAIRRKDRQER